METLLFIFEGVAIIVVYAQVLSSGNMFIFIYKECRATTFAFHRTIPMRFNFYGLWFT